MECEKKKKYVKRRKAPVAEALPALPRGGVKQKLKLSDRLPAPQLVVDEGEVTDFDEPEDDFHLVNSGAETLGLSM